MTLQELKQRAARRGAELLALRPGRKLPGAMRGKAAEKSGFACRQQPIRS